MIIKKYIISNGDFIGLKKLIKMAKDEKYCKLRPKQRVANLNKVIIVKLKTKAMITL